MKPKRPAIFHPHRPMDWPVWDFTGSPDDPHSWAATLLREIERARRARAARS